MSFSHTRNASQSTPIAMLASSARLPMRGWECAGLRAVVDCGRLAG
jgi:hypothetical protein